MKYTMTAWCQR